MSMSDPIADMITRVRNGVRGRLPRVDIPNSKLKVEIARILKNEGYISNFKINADSHQGRLRVFLKYGRNMQRVITDLQRVSRPGLSGVLRQRRDSARLRWAGDQRSSPLHGA